MSRRPENTSHQPKLPSSVRARASSAHPPAPEPAPEPAQQLDALSWTEMMDDMDRSARSIDLVYSSLLTHVKHYKNGNAVSFATLETLLNKTLPMTETDRQLELTICYLARLKRAALIEFLFKSRRACLLLLVDGDTAAIALGVGDDLEIVRDSDGFHVAHKRPAAARAREPRSASPPAPASETAGKRRHRGGRNRNRNRDRDRDRDQDRQGQGRSPAGTPRVPTMGINQVMNTLAALDRDDDDNDHHASGADSRKPAIRESEAEATEDDPASESGPEDDDVPAKAAEKVGPAESPDSASASALSKPSAPGGYLDAVRRGTVKAVAKPSGSAAASSASSGSPTKLPASSPGSPAQGKRDGAAAAGGARAAAKSPAQPQSPARVGVLAKDRAAKPSAQADSSAAARPAKASSDSSANAAILVNAAKTSGSSASPTAAAKPPSSSLDTASATASDTASATASDTASATASASWADD